MDKFNQLIQLRKELLASQMPSKKTKMEEGEGLEGSCWEGYIAIGTKVTEDGRTVPNCVPEQMNKIVKEGFPIPSPNSEEDENIFISRCVSSIIDEYDQNVALGICYSKWNEK